MVARLLTVFGVALAALIVGDGAVHAQSGKANKGPNGGSVVMAEGHPIEFVHSGLEITFYLADHNDKPLPTKDLTGRALVQDGGKTTTVPLSGAEPNRLVGKLQAPLSSKARIVMSTVVFTGGHKHTFQARFTTN